MKHLLLLLLGLWLLPALVAAQEETPQGLLIDWHPSGTMMAYSRYYSYEVIVLDVNTNEVVNTFATSDPLFDAPQWSPDGSLLTFLDSLHSITVWSNAWDPDLANQAYYLDMLDRLQLERAAPISGFVWHPSGTSLAHSVSGTIFVWNVATDDYRQLPRSDYIYEISDLTWFDEDTLLIGDTSPAAILINAYTGELEAVFVVRGTIQIVSVSAVSPSPDRSYVALASPFGRIEIWDPTQGEFRDGFGLVSDIAVRSTFGSETRMSWVEWNPTGEYIAMADQDGLIRVWEAETLELVQEYNGLPNGSVAWSPDGTQLAFSTASGGLQIVEGPPLVPSITPPPVPRGQVLYMAETEDERSALFLYDFDSDTEQQITDGSFSIGSPQLSPQGDWIVFSSGTRENQNLYLMRSNGSELHALTSSPGFELFPAWSPDGNWIAYEYVAEQGYAEIYIIHRSGGDPVRVTTTGGARPDWSSDGERIAFIWRDAEGVYRLYTVYIDGSDQVQLTFGDVNAFYPKWSPGSHRIAFNGGIGHNYYIQADGSGGPQRIPNLYTDSELEWIDEDTLAYTDPMLGGYRGVFIISIDGTDIIQLEIPFLWKANDVSLSGLKISP